VLAVWFAAILLAKTVAVPQPPTWDGALQPGCDVDEIRDYAGLHWFVHVWVQFPDDFEAPWIARDTNLDAKRSHAHKWYPALAYAIREPKEGLKALEDCHKWLKAIEKIRQNEQRPSSH